MSFVIVYRRCFFFVFVFYCLHSPVAVQYVRLMPTNVTVLSDYSYYVFLKSTLCSFYEECGFQS